MNNYVVSWSIDIEASSPEDAATRAREIMLDPESIATVFEVTNAKLKEVVIVDLEELKTLHVIRNHNGTYLGSSYSKKEAEKEAAFYRQQTGNAAYVAEAGEEGTYGF